MSLTVVTVTANKHPDLLERCKASVQAALPPGVSHEIIICEDPEEYPLIRYGSLRIDEHVAVVDDDDTIDPRVLVACQEAIELNPTAGMIYTDEVRISPSGRHRANPRTNQRYEQVSRDVQSIHHLRVFRAEAVTQKGNFLHQKFGVGCDWFYTACAALSHGAVHIPMNGYYWHIQPTSHSSDNNMLYVGRVQEMGEAIREAVGTRFGLIPTYTPLFMRDV